MTTNLTYYEQFCGGDTTEERINLVQKNISGGEITKEEIDLIRNHPRAFAITISGLRQNTFDYFVQKFGKQFRVINFWKCPKVADLDKLASLNTVEYMLFYWNQKATKLWDFRANRRLKGLSLNDFRKMHDLKNLSNAPALEELVFGYKIWSKYVVKSLAPLAECKSLKYLSFDAKCIIDGDIEPLVRIPRLENLNFSANQFTAEQVAWLRARLNEKVKGEALSPYIRFSDISPLGGKNILIVGKGKPFLNSIKDKKRIEKYIQSFEDLVRKYACNPGMKPPLSKDNKKCRELRTK